MKAVFGQNIRALVYSGIFLLIIFLCHYENAYAALKVTKNEATEKAQEQLEKTTQNLEKSFERTSNGLKTNKAADDSAGLGVSESARHAALTGTANTHDKQGQVIGKAEKIHTPDIGSQISAIETAEEARQEESESSQLENLNLQEAMKKQADALKTLEKVSKQSSDVAKKIIQNLEGGEAKDENEEDDASDADKEGEGKGKSNESAREQTDTNSQKAGTESETMKETSNTYDEHGRVVGKTETTRDSKEPDMVNVTIEEKKYNGLGQVSTETIETNETGESSNTDEIKNVEHDENGQVKSFSYRDEEGKSHDAQVETGENGRLVGFEDSEDANAEAEAEREEAEAEQQAASDDKQLQELTAQQESEQKQGEKLSQLISNVLKVNSDIAKQIIKNVKGEDDTPDTGSEGTGMAHEIKNVEYDENRRMKSYTYNDEEGNSQNVKNVEMETGRGDALEGREGSAGGLMSASGREGSSGGLISASGREGSSGGLMSASGREGSAQGDSGGFLGGVFRNVGEALGIVDNQPNAVTEIATVAPPLLTAGQPVPEGAQEVYSGDGNDASVDGAMFDSEGMPRDRNATVSDRGGISTNLSGESKFVGRTGVMDDGVTKSTFTDGTTVTRGPATDLEGGIGNIRFDQDTSPAGTTVQGADTGLPADSILNDLTPIGARDLSRAETGGGTNTGSGSERKDTDPAPADSESILNDIPGSRGPMMDVPGEQPGGVNAGGGQRAGNVADFNLDFGCILPAELDSSQNIILNQAFGQEGAGGNGFENRPANTSGEQTGPRSEGSQGQAAGMRPQAFNPGTMVEDRMRGLAMMAPTIALLSAAPQTRGPNMGPADRPEGPNVDLRESIRAVQAAMDVGLGAIRNEFRAEATPEMMNRIESMQTAIQNMAGVLQDRFFSGPPATGTIDGRGNMPPAPMGLVNERGPINRPGEEGKMPAPNREMNQPPPAVFDGAVMQGIAAMMGAAMKGVDVETFSNAMDTMVSRMSPERREMGPERREAGEWTRPEGAHPLPMPGMMGAPIVVGENMAMPGILPMGGLPMPGERHLDAGAPWASPGEARQDFMERQNMPFDPSSVNIGQLIGAGPVIEPVNNSQVAQDQRLNNEIVQNFLRDNAQFIPVEILDQFIPGHIIKVGPNGVITALEAAYAALNEGQKSAIVAGIAQDFAVRGEFCANQPGVELEIHGAFQGVGPGHGDPVDVHATISTIHEHGVDTDHMTPGIQEPPATVLDPAGVIHDIDD